jgi:uncharacterized protein (DUF1810 family)
VAGDPEDPHDLQRFLAAQDQTYQRALSEIGQGRKRTHWMWFVFPQLAGLGSSTTAAFYAVRSREEAAAYLAHPVLGARLRECAGALLSLSGTSASDIFGYPDDLKLRSSMTLFDAVSPPGSAFKQVLDRYFGGERDERTLRLLGDTFRP